MNKIICILILLMILPLVSADTFRQDTVIEISHPVRVDGFPVTNALVNITIKNPQQEPLINFSPMTYNTATEEHTFTLPSENTLALGEYPYCISVTANLLNKTSCFSFTVTPSGQEATTGQAILYMFALVLGLFMFSLSLFGAIKIPFKNQRNEEGWVVKVNDLKYVKIMLWFASYLLLIFLTFLAWNISHGFLWFTVVSNFFQASFWVLISFFLPVWIVFIIASIINFIEDRKLKDALRRGLPTQTTIR